MEANLITESKKRQIGAIMPSELGWKLKSKLDFITYLDQHRKYLDKALRQP